MDKILDKEKEIKAFLQPLLSSENMAQFIKLLKEYTQFNRDELIKEVLDYYSQNT